MKFAKELEQDLVPEWRVKYLDYKAGKKHVKAVARATHRLNATPKPSAAPNLLSRNSYGAIHTTPRTNAPSTIRRFDGPNDSLSDFLRDSPAPFGADLRPGTEASTSDEGPLGRPKKTPPVTIPQNKRTPEISDTIQYGSFVPTPPANKTTYFALPGPALLDDSQHKMPSPLASNNKNGDVLSRPTPARSATGRSATIGAPSHAYEIGKTASPSRKGTFSSIRNRLDSDHPGKFMRRIFSQGTPLTPSESQRMDLNMVSVDQVRQREKEFFKWMNKQLEKVETFYKMKEDEAGARLEVLREQLHEMRNRRIQEVAAAQHERAARKEAERRLVDFGPHSQQDENARPNSRDHLKSWFNPVERVMEGAKAKVLGPRPGGNSRALQNMQQSPALKTRNQDIRDDDRDYVRRPHHDDGVLYRDAKRKLKLALREFYRGMELLKSYALLNRTAFRKINKKYDKAVDAHPPLRYMSEKVNKAWFVKSDVLDGHIHAVEDLYARYFERGNHKIATGKLRSVSRRKADQSFIAFRNGLLIGIGGVFGIQGLIYGRDLLRHPDPTIRVQTSYLLQIYAGYFLALYLFSWFCLDCSIWTRNKINYQFVFEYDPRHAIDWRELAEFPSFLLFLLGLFLWVNFTRYGTPAMFIFYPVILVFVSLVYILLPAPYIFPKSREWFAYSHWRLLLAGLYPVEFRDFFLGDMYCSLTYFMGNIELFFCLYANYWNNPTQCNSTHSRLLGFFSALPGIWRALQCLRRYYDTRNVFPHLVNCGKYFATILFYVTLSIYRIDQTHGHLALFVTLAVLNSIYTSIWDLLMDWSLLQPHASKRFLRDVRGYKNPHYYYAAMVVDPILRFNWIFYAIYTHDLQHSSMVSFFVAFSEITRRGIWVIFRVENEHCANVARFKASRDVPLPYLLHSESDEDFVRTHADDDETSPEDTSSEHEHGQTTGSSPTLYRRRTHTNTGATLEAQESNASTVRRRTFMNSPAKAFTKVLADAHTQDFEKKRKPATASLKAENSRGSAATDDGQESSDDGDESDADQLDEQDALDVEALLRERRGAKQRDDR